jgi:cutinase
MFKLAAEKCPDAKIVAGGYRYVGTNHTIVAPKVSELTYDCRSQGTAVMSATIPTLDAAVQEQIKGVVLFGYTKNQQNKGGIDGFPAEKLKVFCNDRDEVCEETLNIKPAHFLYFTDAAGPAPEFLAAKIRAT